MVTGVSASGKDFLLERARLHEPRIGTDIPIVGMGSAIVAKLREQTALEADRDRIKHVVSNDTVRGAVRSIVADVAAHPAAILNGHITYRQQGVLVSNPDIDAEIDPAAYAVVVADPGDIADWRAADGSRHREPETVEQIAYHQDFTVRTAEQTARMLGARCQIVENVIGNANESSLVLARMVVDICHK